MTNNYCKLFEKRPLSCIKSKETTIYCLLVGYSFLLGSQNVDFIGYLGRYNKQAQK
jgi:hypothetical protein